MNYLQNLYPGDTWASFLIRILAEITLITAFTVLFIRIFARNNSALRHGFCRCALFCVLLAPLSTLGLQAIGWRTFQIELDHQHPMPNLSNAIAISPINSIPEPFWTIERARGTASLLLLIWSIGTCVLLVRLLLGSHKVNRIRESAINFNHPALEEIIEDLRQSEGISKAPIKVSKRVHSPVVVGALKPTVILPDKLLQRLDSQQIRSVLAHELAHVRQRDPFVGLVQRLVEAAYWPHPLVHVLNRDLVRAREEVCDNVALHSTPAPQYADTLLTVALGIGGVQPHPSMVGLMTKPWRLEERVRGLLDPRRRLNTTMNTRHLALMGIMLITGTSVIAGGHVVAAPNPFKGDDTLDLYTHYNTKTHKVTVTQSLKKGTGPNKTIQVKVVNLSEPKVAHSKTFKVQLDKAHANAKAYTVTLDEPHAILMTDGKNGKAMTIQLADGGPDEIQLIASGEKGDGKPKVVKIQKRVLSGHLVDGKNITVTASNDAKVLEGHAVTITTDLDVKDAKPVTKNYTVTSKDGKAFIVTGDDGAVRVEGVAIAEPADQVKHQLRVKVDSKPGEKVTKTVTIEDDGKVKVMNITGSDPVILKDDTVVAKTIQDRIKSGVNDMVVYTTQGDSLAKADQLNVQVLKAEDAVAGNQVMKVYAQPLGGHEVKVNGHQVITTVPDQETTVYIEDGHVRVVGGKIKVVYGHPKTFTTKVQIKTKYQVKTKKP